MQVFQEFDRPAEKVVFVTKIEDVIGGVSIDTSGLSEKDIIPLGTVVGKGSNGLFKILKTAKIYLAAGNTETNYQVYKGHLFKVGDFFASAVGAKAYAITAIDRTNEAYDIITIGTTLGVAVGLGATVFAALAESATTTSAFAVTPYALIGHSVQVKVGDNHLVDAWIRCSLYEQNAPPVTAAIKTALTNNVIWL